MKKIMIILSALVITISAQAQTTVEAGIKMYNYGKLTTAQGILSPLAASNAMANYYLGLTYLDQGNMAMASSTFAKYPDDAANISGTARVAFASKDAAKGNQITKDLAAKSKKKEWMQEKYAADAITYSTGGDYHQAITWYTDALTKNDDPSTHIGLGDAYRKVSGGGGEAMTNYEHVTEKDVNNSLGYTRIGDLWYDAKNYQSALDNYEKAKNADATNPLPYKALANAYSRSGRYKQALENLKKYQTLSDNTTADKIEYLRALYLAQSFCDAAKMATDEMNNFPDKTELYGILGYSQAECGDSVQALKNLRIYLRMQDPKKILSGDYIQFGKLFMKLGMLDSAGVYYAKGIADDTAKNKTDIYRQIAEAYKAKKDYPNAADWYNNLVKANPETQPLDYFWRGYMYYYSRDLKKTLSSFEEFQAKYPDQPSAIYWHARAVAAIDSEASQGTAIPLFQQWLDKVGPTYDKKSDMKIAYQYMLLYYYNKKDKANTTTYKEKIREIDPNDSLLKQIDEADKANNAPKKPAAPAKPKK